MSGDATSLPPRESGPPCTLAVVSRPAQVRLRPLQVSDAGELLTLQRAAFVSEAQLYNEPALPPLTQTIDELREELRTSRGIAAVSGTRMVGAIRMRQHPDTLQLNRLVVAPDMQGMGIGTTLLLAAEAQATSRRASLFTGDRSTANLRLYRRLGYVETSETSGPSADGIGLVHLTKELDQSVPSRSRDDD